MAIKDFKRKKLSTGRTLYLSETKAVGIQHSPRGMATIPWAVDISDKNQQGRLIVLKHFKTRQQAMSFAKEYMRTHK